MHRHVYVSCIIKDILGVMNYVHPVWTKCTYVATVIEFHRLSFHSTSLPSISGCLSNHHKMGNDQIHGSYAETSSGTANVIGQFHESFYEGAQNKQPEIDSATHCK